MISISKELIIINKKLDDLLEQFSLQSIYLPHIKQEMTSVLSEFGELVFPVNLRAGAHYICISLFPFNMDIILVDFSNTYPTDPANPPVYSVTPFWGTNRVLNHHLFYFIEKFFLE